MTMNNLEHDDTNDAIVDISDSELSWHNQNEPAVYLKFHTN